LPGKHSRAPANGSVGCPGNERFWIEAPKRKTAFTILYAGLFAAAKRRVFDEIGFVYFPLDIAGNAARLVDQMKPAFCPRQGMGCGNLFSRGPH
jgi:hypothetical protein